VKYILITFLLCSFIKADIIDIALEFLDREYVSNVLESDSKERLIIDLDRLDCVTFIEYSLAKHLSKTPKDFNKTLTNIRYKNGLIDGYLSRNHYFLSWIDNNQQNGFLRDITRDFNNSEVYSKNISFISKNIKLYPKIKQIEEIQKIEKEINSKEYFYIKKENLKDEIERIKSGDIIAITTKIKNLDISHIGFAIWRDSKLHLLHASSKHKKVLISKKSLYQYLLDNKNQSGILVLRVN